MVDPIHVAVEQYLYWRGEGMNLYEMVGAVNGKAREHGKPEEMTGDAVVYWLAGIWDGELAGSEE